MRQILIVDDEAGMRVTMREGLAGEGYRIYLADGFEQAKAVLESQAIDVVVCDIVLPEVSGIDILDHVICHYPSTKMIMITGAPSIENAVSAVRRRAFDYLTKPVSLDDLAKSVRNAVMVKELEETKENYERELSFKVLQLEKEVQERKEVERKLRQSEEKYRLLIEQQSDFVIKHAPDSRILFASPNFLRKFDRQEDEVIGQKYWPEIHPDDKKNSLDAWKEARSGVKRGTIEQRLKTREGYRWVSWQWQGMLNENGQVEGVVATGRDITEAKDRERVLAFQAMLLNQIKDSITAIDLDGFVTYFSPGAMASRNPVTEDMVGRHVSVIENTVGKAGIPGEIIKQTQEEGRWSGHIAGTDPNGNDWVANLRTWLTYDEQGITNGIVGIASDITEEIRMREEQELLREQLMRSQKMEAIGRLAGGVAHDFNNLLTGINGNVSLLLMDVEPDNPMHEFFVEVLETVQRASELTMQLLTFSKKNILSPRSLDLNELIINLKRMLLRVLGEDIQLETHFDKAESPVRADPGQIEQILVNLAINSRDAMPKGGTLSITTGRAEVSKERPVMDLPAGDYVTFSVADTGEGLSEEARAHLFEPFFTTKPLGAGSGLGLATVYASVTRHGGAIIAEEGRKLGACFTVYLPSEAEPVASNKHVATKMKLPGGNESILVVEDEDLVRKIAKRILDRLGYKVTAVSSGEDAVDLCDQNGCDFDLIMTDVIMQGMNGYELAELTRKHNPSLGILYTSGYAEDKLKEFHDLEDTEGIFLAKPYSPADLAERIRHILDQRKK